MRLVIPLLVCGGAAAACSSPPKAIVDAGPSTIDTASTADAAIDADPTDCHAASPSGYQCDPWSTHLLVLTGVKRAGDKLTLSVTHDPDFEGPADENMPPPPAHNFYENLTFELAITPAIRDYLCVIFTKAGGGAPIDSAAAGFVDSVDAHVWASLLSDGSNDNTAHVANIASVCGSSKLTPVAAPAIVMTKPVLPDVALMIGLTPDLQQLKVGDTATAYLARGFLYVDEESELSPAISLKMVGP